MTDKLSEVPSIIVDGILWSCYITDKGQRYVWRSPGGRGLAGRMMGEGFYWSSIGGTHLGRDFKTLAQAMQAASAASRKKRAA